MPHDRGRADPPASCCRVHQDGDFGEMTALFDVADFEQIARIKHPRRRRQVSEAERVRLRAMGFKKGHEAYVNVEPMRACLRSGSLRGVSIRPGHQSPTRRKLGPRSLHRRHLTVSQASMCASRGPGARILRK